MDACAGSGDTSPLQFFTSTTTRHERHARTTSISKRRVGTASWGTRTSRVWDSGSRVL